MIAFLLVLMICTVDHDWSVNSQANLATRASKLSMFKHKHLGNWSFRM